MSATQENSKQLSKSLNVTNFLRAREQGPISGLQAIRDFYKIKTSKKTLQINKSMDFNHSDESSFGVEYIKGGSKSILGSWKVSDDKYMIGEVPFMHETSETAIGFNESNASVEDMCEGIYNAIVYVYNTSEEILMLHDPANEDLAAGYNAGNRPLLGILEIMYKTRGRGNGIECYEHFDSKKTRLYCCSDIKSFGNIYMVVGGDKRIICYNGVAPERTFKVREKVYTVAFDETANFIISGHSDGNINIYDRRSSQKPTKIAVRGDKRLVDVQFLSTEKVIVSGSTKRLYTIDLRSRRRVTEFLGHKHSETKQPLSVANDMVCATGSDNIIRIWHKSGGLPIHQIEPTVDGKKLRGWLTSHHGHTYLYCFEGMGMKVYEIL